MTRIFDPKGPVDSRSALLAASAGTGKTFSIAQIFLRLVLDPDQSRGPDRPDGIDPREILVVTFTRAATAEMRNRIRTGLRDARDILKALLRQDWAIDGPGHPLLEGWPALEGFLGVLANVPDARQRLVQALHRLEVALAGFDEITISTIHGFCQRMLIRHALESGATLRADLAEDSDAWTEEVALDRYRRFVHDLPPLLWKVLEWRMKASASRWKRIARELASHPEGSLWRPATRVLERDIAEWIGKVESVLRAVQEDAGKVSPDLHESARRARDQGICNKNLLSDNRLRLLQVLPEVLSSQASLPPASMDLQTIDSALDLLGRCLLPGKGKVLPADLAATVAHFRGRLEEWKALVEESPIPREALIWGLEDLEDAIRRDLPLRKRRDGVFTYDDLIHAFRKALESPRGPMLARAVREQYRVALIDEFQDTDGDQWEIFRRLFLEGGEQPLRLWIIGDAKQSIYRFRGADIGSYLKAQEAVETRFELTRNFRTDGPLLRAINGLWSYGGRARILPSSSGVGKVLPFLEPRIPAPVVKAHHEARRVRFRSRTGSRAPLRIVWLSSAGSPSGPSHGDGGEPAPGSESPKPPGAGTNAPWNAEGAREAAIRWTAADIRAFLDAGAEVLDRSGSSTDGGGERWVAVAPKDLAVLVRSHREGAMMQRALRDLGIPSVRGGQESVFETSEAEDLLRLLRCLERPLTPPSVATLLSLPIFGRDATDLEALSGPSRNGDDPDPAAAAWNRWIERLERWQEAWRSHGIWRLWAEMIREEEANPLDLLERWNGERVLTNWFHLVEWIQGESVRRHLGPREQADLLARRIENRDDGPMDREAMLIRLESDLDAVQIVTIHSAKGLDYPFLWIPGLWSPFQETRVEEGIWLEGEDADAGEPGGREWFLPRGFDEERQKRAKALADLAAFQESLRLAYVAMTRPRHEMTVVTAMTSKGFPNSPLAAVLHGHHAEFQGDDPRKHREVLAQALKAMQPREVLADLRNLERRFWSEEPSGEPASPEGTGPVQCIEAGPIDMPPRWQPPVRDIPLPEARTWRRPLDTLDRLWTRASFSSLARRARDPDIPEPDVEEGAPRASDEAIRSSRAPGEAEAPEDVAVPSEAPLRGSGNEAVAGRQEDAREAPWADQPSLLGGFPAGPRYGDLLHEILEALDFREADSDRCRDVVVEVFSRHDQAPEQAEMVARALPSILATPLGGVTPEDPGPALKDLPWRDTLREMAFDIPVRGGIQAVLGPGSLVGRKAIRETFLAAGDQDPVLRAFLPRLDALDFQAFHGYLTGGIDLVYRWRPPGAPEPLWWIADYKSNRLCGRDEAETLSRYGDEAMRQAMVEHLYVLQYHLYLVALHRFLRWRLPGYDYDRHVGGVRYLFLRGMAGPEHAGRWGVFRDRPPKARIEALSRLFEVRAASPEVAHGL